MLKKSNIYIFKKTKPFASELDLASMVVGHQAISGNGHTTLTRVAKGHTTSGDLHKRLA